jgi:hypothetical protein
MASRAFFVVATSKMAWSRLPSRKPRPNQQKQSKKGIPPGWEAISVQ